ncbi:polyprenyl synthetase family protein [Balneolaceae bacterium ANBcel3]|nr:polyprenyl synthetase family protein [Balneolaceae bacterium ANBcel3]
MNHSIEHIGKLIEDRLQALDIPKHPSSLYDPVRYTLSLGGKRIRPSLVLLSTGLCDGEVESALDLAMGIEMLHNFTLIHDDIMDHADTRRGKECVHIKWDEPTAILAGDVLFTLAVQQITLFEPGSDAAQKALGTFLESVKKVCEGQALDMEFQDKEQVGLDAYLTMIRLKTAELMECSMALGALAARADEKNVKNSAAVGYHAGMAFQIQDDILDVIGDPQKTGKKVGGDIMEGKKTYLSVLATERADDTNRLILKDLSAQKDIGEEDVLRISRMYHSLGVIDEGIKDISLHYEKALGFLDEFPKNDFYYEIKRVLDKLKVRDY